MSAPKHTAGPLTVNERGIICVANRHGYQQPVKLAGAWVDGAWTDDDEALANATLYAAAPDLLEALPPLAPADEETAAHFASMDPDDMVAIHIPVRCILRARAAIAKATGADS